MTNILDSTRDRILAAAEELFARTGVATTSLRAITALARVNLAAVNYHFGSKDGLVEAVYRRRLEPLNRARLKNLEKLEAEAGKRPPSLEAVMEAFILPVVKLGQDPAQGGPTVMRLLGQTHTEAAGYFRTYFAGEYREVLDRYEAVLARILPDLPGDQIKTRLAFLVGAMTYPIAERQLLELLTGAEIRREDIDAMMQQLVPFAVAGFEAPPARTPRRRVPAARKKTTSTRSRK
jgi:AcrR family transcriptional regulator